MIPILFEKDETAFISNGIARLRDCISAVVSEERNGIYELDFTYPVTGANYEKIICGRIVGVTHDESGDIQPFEIVGQTRPINGIVSFHCVHISYRQSQMVVVANSVNSLSQAFQLFAIASPSNPFTYEADFTATGYMSASDGVPRSVRQFLGGVRGSVLDTYGGEYEWDKWRVILHQNRGEVKDFAIRYGVNLLNYNDEVSYQGTFTSCLAFWKNEDEIVTATASLNENGYNGNDIRVPLDLTDKFEEKPTTAQLESEALAYMQRNQTNIPAQSIRVDFVRLAELGEFAQFQDLLRCKLCDSIKVIFPMYNVSASFKIVKTEWNVLEGRYIGMELGTLSTTLSEALGIGDTSSTSGGGGGGGDDYIVEHGFSNNWNYRKWASGFAECWRHIEKTNIASTTPWSGATSTYYANLGTDTNYPFEFTEKPTCISSAQVSGGNGWLTQNGNNATTTNPGQFYVITPASSTVNVYLNIYAFGYYDTTTFTPNVTVYQDGDTLYLD